ncbi:hypothetical protein JCM17380_32150 [Desulfosporosinus burensis]
MILLNKKTVIITVAIVFLVALSFTVYTFFNSSKGFEILINNNTNKEISGLNITYKNVTKDIKSRIKIVFSIRPISRSAVAILFCRE